MDNKNVFIENKMLDFDKEFYEGLYSLAESDGEYYESFDKCRSFFRKSIGEAWDGGIKEEIDNREYDDY